MRASLARLAAAVPPTPPLPPKLPSSTGGGLASDRSTFRFAALLMFVGGAVFLWRIRHPPLDVNTTEFETSPLTRHLVSLDQRIKYDPDAREKLRKWLEEEDAKKEAPAAAAEQH